MTGVAGRTVVVTGASGPAGRATVAALTAAGASVVAVSRDPSALEAPGVRAEAVDLLDAAAVAGLAARVGPVDGVLHLVGGWRGGKGFAANTLEDAELLHDALVRTLQHVTLAFHEVLRASDAGRFAIVSAAAVERPTAGSAAYVSAKAAAEAWTLALADSFAGTAAAAHILVVQAIGERPGWTPATTLADALVRLWDTDAQDLNGRRGGLAA
ncbi:NADP-dependent 3-hydroxy acid dehydrogenase YdfG [Motilibacter rhizosphaerae]|uniref:NADP-dependent 3-hydroxy acid dehydrogenase YdfG n=1 Tax=Motilibacter rhizosphaerae TaxID=598652 RepID=A0A4Q7NAP8_9ACTN|nr:SDR family NAD(P)-dependent oxidoreductase [Motilibacter rhizosphaerae]RZS80011.1 NADP-dependent 3-hydroxy acid dehydrogenase YdfG [Motilibacter rhizosphaerae]